MGTNIVRTRSCVRVAAIVCAGMLVFLVRTPAALAVHNLSLFQVDGNTTVDPSPPGEDWNTAVGGGAQVSPGGGHFSAVISDGAADGTSISGNRDSHLTSGSKDTADVSTWRISTSGSVPPKADLLVTRSAIYKYSGPAAGAVATGDTILYFMATRANNSGDTTLGFWSFLNPIVASNGRFALAPGATSACPNSGTLHCPGDLFVLGTFTQGGISNIEAFTWNGSGLSPNPNILACDSVEDNACAVVNSVPLPLGSDLNVGNIFSNNTADAGEFFEGGIDLNSALGQASPPCFASFMVQTISSQSLGTAEDKDFILGTFDTCTISVNKACFNGQVNADNATANFQIGGYVTNTGLGAIHDLQLSDVPTPASAIQCFSASGSLPGGANPDPAALSAACSGFNPASAISCSSPIAAGASLCYGAQISTTGNGQSDTITARATGIGGGDTNTPSQSAVCTAPIDPHLTVTKSCNAFLTPSGGELVVEVDDSFQVCNTGQALLTGVTVTDSVQGQLSPISSLDVGDCTTLSGSYNPSNFGHCSGASSTVCALNSQCPVGQTCVANSNFTDSASATGACADGTFCSQPIATSNTSIAQCALCQGASCTILSK